jgi:hypothetical protein
MPLCDWRYVRQMQNSTIGTPIRHVPVCPSVQGRLEFAGYDLARGGQKSTRRGC